MDTIVSAAPLANELQLLAFAEAITITEQVNAGLGRHQQDLSSGQLEQDEKVNPRPSASIPTYVLL